MKRRLFFLLPDITHARSVVSELLATGLATDHVHILARPGIELQDLPNVNDRQRGDFDASLENVLWNGNLAVFFIAFLALVVLAYLQPDWYWLLLPAVVMLATFLLGEEFTRRIPDVHLSEFRDALQHGEILLMVDVPVTEVERIEALVHKHHPEAVPGGVSWHIDALHA